MLVLHRRSGESIMIGDNIKIKVTETGSDIRLAIEAPRDVPILRYELYEEAQAQRAAQADS